MIQVERTDNRVELVSLLDEHVDSDAESRAAYMRTFDVGCLRLTGPARRYRVRALGRDERDAIVMSGLAKRWPGLDEEERQDARSRWLALRAYDLAVESPGEEPGPVVRSEIGGYALALSSLRPTTPGQQSQPAGSGISTSSAADSGAPVAP